MSYGPVKIDDSLAKEEGDVTEALNQNNNEDDDDLNHIDKIFKAVKSYGPYQVRIRALKMIFVAFSLFDIMIINSSILDFLLRNLSDNVDL